MVSVIVGGYSAIIHRPDLLLLLYSGVVPSKVTTAPYQITSNGYRKLAGALRVLATGSNSIVLEVLLTLRAPVFFPAIASKRYNISLAACVSIIPNPVVALELIWVQ